MASESCCAAGIPVKSDYVPRGSRRVVGDTEIYHVGSGGAPVVLIMDIFGFSFPQVFQVADRIADSGFAVGVPDIFRGSPWPMDKFPPKPEDNFMEWIKPKMEYLTQIKPDVDATVSLLRTTAGAKEGKYGVIGFCAGAALALQAGAQADVGAVGAAHPAFGLLSDGGVSAAECLQCPVALLPAKGDDVEKVHQVVSTKPFAGKCVLKEFRQQVHGFMAARGDWKDPLVTAAAAEGIEVFVKLMQENLS
mmetsp:Transcript_12309/g.29237  ORF Transcript_12309/g.29237 Transcript_12309/m.29237 type:complete len:249 (+) Transcript_12309:95-841(+)|eukprot:CAMPEP_0177604962 /NCGR_PEP_ID=MMETSP0419_2-20121207/16421_1 /TAXON_ID=582737 /ORGANISM="Tetraselmis sp., Strain GSL018" /LENGTH=248 /DNA_ID=CAMNT_0019099027 /DNA_START=74 /DNA_END=820 /DNA_ORIENTATION=+